MADLWVSRVLACDRVYASAAPILFAEIEMAELYLDCGAKACGWHEIVREHWLDERFGVAALDIDADTAEQRFLREDAGARWTRYLASKTEGFPLESDIALARLRLRHDAHDVTQLFDLGLLFKSGKRWLESAEAFEGVIALDADLVEPAWWNVGIATTALRDWKRGRRAWRRCGVTIPGGDDGPIEADFGMAKVRLPNSDVVWGRRIDPARVVVDSIPLPESGYRWGDIVLHDRAPNGECIAGGKTHPVFDVLERASRSEIPTLSLEVHLESEEAAQRLVDAFATTHFKAEDWTAGGSERRVFGVASPRGLATQVLEAWRTEAPASRWYGDIETLL